MVIFHSYVKLPEDSSTVFGDGGSMWIPLWPRRCMLYMLPRPQCFDSDCDGNQKRCHLAMERLGCKGPPWKQVCLGFNPLLGISLLAECLVPPTGCMPGVFAVSNQLCLGDWFEHLCSQQVVGYPAVTGAQLYASFLPILWTFWVKRSWIEERLCRLNSFAWQLFPMVIRTVKKEKENLPYRQQSVVGFFCIAEYHGRKFAGSILAEKRDDNNKKIAYQVEIYGIEKPRVISCADVKA